jgi:hypothetical protein
MPKRSDPTSNAEIVRNVLAPFGFGRRRTICFVATPLRCPRIAVVAAPCIWPNGAPNDASAISVTGH